MSQPPKLPVHLEGREIREGRLFSPTAARNTGPIAEALLPRLRYKPIILEIASGTGQQAFGVCERGPDILWQPSDPDEESRSSIAAYSADLSDRFLPPLDVNVMEDMWWQPFEGHYTDMYCANMIHIAPIEALLGLAEGAGHILQSGGAFYLYGPFLYGDQSAPSNLAFRDRLQARNPQWGVRELDFVKHIFATWDLNFTESIAMPAENHILVFQKS